MSTRRASTLLPTARQDLVWGEISAAEWLREYPNCDECGCPDDRCIGFHHDDPADCQCLVYAMLEYSQRGKPSSKAKRYGPVSAPRTNGVPVGGNTTSTD